MSALFNLAINADALRAQVEAALRDRTEGDACLTTTVGGELPIGFGVFLLSRELPGGDILDHGLLFSDTRAQTLGGQDAEFGFGTTPPKRAEAAWDC